MDSDEIRALEAEIAHLRAENNGLRILVFELRQIVKELHAIFGKASGGDV